jgi:dihydrofolate synthase/folylpolyglutamate synthase
MKFDSTGDVYAYLNRFLNFERRLEPTEYRLDRMQRLRELFGRLDDAYRVVHVAGSKGKGSTATMIAACLAEAGGTVGLYTSPHLLSFTERIAIGGVPVDDGTLLSCARDLAGTMDGESPADFPGGEAPTYFELLTMLGFLCFRKAGCTDAVIEVGLGGRLDSTNVVTPAACVITPIELEHTELLGATIPLIAYEKAGIIKPGVPVFTSAARPEALDVIRARARDLGAPLTVLDEAVSLDDIRVSAAGTSAVARWRDRSVFEAPMELRTPMIGRVQARNAAIAAMVAKSLGVDEPAILRGVGSARLRARFEIITGDPVVILDGAHTEDSIRACAEDFSALFPGGGSLLFGCAKDKPARPMAAALRPFFSSVIVTRPGTFKESDTADIEAAFAAEGFEVARLDDTAKAIESALGRASGAGMPLLVTGSFYLCAATAAIIG